MNPSIAISIEFPAWRKIPGLLKITRRSIVASVDMTGHGLCPESELSILLSEDARIRGLNKTWRGIDKSTNVLSFPLGDNVRGPLLGDIVISYETLDRESRIARKPFENHYAHMVVHGFLHLLGFDHENDHDAGIMEAWERKILLRLDIPDPYPISPKSKV